MRHYECDSCKACDFSRGLFTIRPKEPIPVGRLSHDPQAIIRAYEMGRRDAQEVSKNLLRWIA